MLILNIQTNAIGNEIWVARYIASNGQCLKCNDNVIYTGDINNIIIFSL